MKCTLYYRGLVITPNNTGYVNYDFYYEDAEVIEGNGESIEDCIDMIDEMLDEDG